MSDSFNIDIGPMDWALFQQQRATLISLVLVTSPLSESQQDHLTGILHLTDHIIDTARDRGIDVPGMEGSDE